MDKVVVAVCEDMELAEDTKKTLGENEIEAKIGKEKTSIYVFVSEEDYDQAYKLLDVNPDFFFN